MKQLGKIFFAAGALALFCVQTSFAADITLTWSEGSYTFKDIPDDIVTIVQENQAQIEQALSDNNVSEDKVKEVTEMVKKEYGDLLNSMGFSTTTPYKTAVNGLNDFCDALNDTLPNTQTLQNVWAEAWIGKLVPNFKFGFGVNAGVATLDISSLLAVADALAIDTSEIRDFTDSYDNKLVFPTVTADVRLGGIILPFDIGLAFSTFDTRNFDSLKESIDPAAFDYFSLGGDLRWRIFDKGGKFFHVRGSLSGGGYYTKGGFNVEDSGSAADVDFSSTTLFAGAQVSAKALCFMPFFGGRLLLTKSSVDWKAKANWSEILSSNDVDNEYISQAVSWGILPSTFSGGADSGWGVRPQIYGGLGIDLFVIDITVSGSYDIIKDIIGGAVSVRFSI